jgi:hypothetical protein
MAIDVDRVPQHYRAAALALTVAVSEMAKSLDTPKFSDAFWNVQRASERCKRLRATLDHSAKSESNIYSLVTV